MSSSTDKKNSRLVQGGRSDIYAKRLGWWDRRIFERADDDIQFTITQVYARRPDLVAYDVYGKASLQWLVLQYNNILDINTEFIEDKIIYLPSYERVVFNILNHSEGGNIQ